MHLRRARHHRRFATNSSPEVAGSHLVWPSSSISRHACLRETWAEKAATVCRCAVIPTNLEGVQLPISGETDEQTVVNSHREKFCSGQA